MLLWGQRRIGGTSLLVQAWVAAQQGLWPLQDLQAQETMPAWGALPCWDSPHEWGVFEVGVDPSEGLNSGGFRHKLLTGT